MVPSLSNATASMIKSLWDTVQNAFKEPRVCRKPISLISSIFMIPQQPHEIEGTHFTDKKTEPETGVDMESRKVTRQQVVELRLYSRFSDS